MSVDKHGYCRWQSVAVGGQAGQEPRIQGIGPGATGQRAGIGAQVHRVDNGHVIAHFVLLWGYGETEIERRVVRALFCDGLELYTMLPISAIIPESNE